MRWRVAEEPMPNGGDTRTRWVFAWKPVRVGNHMVWLSGYEIHERFFEPRGGQNGWWSETGRNCIVD